jgi:hypothetical protein
VIVDGTVGGSVIGGAISISFGAIVGGENATNPALGLSLFQNNETLRKLERTDRLNTTDIPEEIELPNGLLKINCCLGNPYFGRGKFRVTRNL